MNRWLVLVALLASGCASRNYTHYLIEPAPVTRASFEDEEGTQLRPFGFGSTTAMNVSWNDGNVITEVQIPMLASGQRIVIEQRLPVVVFYCGATPLAFAEGLPSPPIDHAAPTPPAAQNTPG